MTVDKIGGKTTAISGEVRLGMRLDLPITTTVSEGLSMLGEKEFPTEAESEELTKQIAMRKRKRLPRIPVGGGI